MEKFWSATFTEDFDFPYAIDPSDQLVVEFDQSKTWFALPTKDINVVLDEIRSYQRENKKSYTVFQFYIPDRYMENLVSLALNPENGNVVTGHIIEYFETHAKEVL